MSALKCQALLIWLITFIGMASLRFSPLLSKDVSQNRRISRDVSGGGCVMPQSMENGTYSLRGSNVVKEGELVPHYSVLQLTCPSGYSPSNSALNVCDDIKSDWNEELATCQRTCKPPKSRTVEFTCTIPHKNGLFLSGSCDTKLLSGTTATAKCRSGHHSISSDKQILCSNGRWGDIMPSCKAECGKSTSLGSANVINGTNATNGVFPWHVSIYSIYGYQDTYSIPRYWCGGTLITSTVVISAAHCVYDPVARQVFDANLFTVTAGKMFIDFVHPEDVFIQKTEVKRIEIPVDYGGELTSYSHDLAILLLQTPLTFSDLIMPVCLNLVENEFHEDQSTSGTEAKVVGLGLEQDNGEPSKALKTFIMPIIAKSQCKLESPEGFEKYIVWDKLCAGYLTGIGSGICNQGGGNGLVVSSVERNTTTWYLIGITSLTPERENNNKCSASPFSLFTKPFTHKEFIEDVMDKQGCTMPINPLNGKFVLIGPRKADPGEGVGHISQISLICDKGYTPSDVENNICDEFIDDWIKEFPICEETLVTQDEASDTQPSTSVEGCVIPNHPPNGRYTALSLEDKKPGDIVPPNSSISLKCSPGYNYSISGVNNICDGNTNNWKFCLGACSNNPREIDPSNACVIPAPNRYTKYSLKGGIMVNPGDIAPPYSFLNVECDPHTINTSPTVFCDEGEWSHTIPVCEKQCDPLDSLTVTFSCMIPTPKGRNKVDCDRKVPSESTASPACREGHIAVGHHRLLTCKSGTWNYPKPECSPKCGTRRPKGEKYVIAGQNATKGEFPWHVAIYTQYGQEGQDLLPKYWCGGSIIRRDLVISAAHCFYNALKEKSLDPSLFTIAVGKIFSEFNHIEDSTEPEIQKSAVIEIRIPEFYSGETTSLSNDIAIVVLETPLNFSNLILPICLDLKDDNFDKLQTSPGVIAKVAGFGLVQRDVQKASDTLMTTTMPIVSYKDCKKNSPPEFEKYIVSGKLCAGYLNGTSVCKGDSGGGLVVSTKVRDIETWYLRGIVSTAPKSEFGDFCDQTYSTFERPFDHKTFIEYSLYY